MKITTILFDLDGTLLPMDLNKFIKDYFGRLAAKLAPHGYDSDELIKTIWKGIGAMVKNDGSKTNEEAFWEAVVSSYGESILKDKPIFDDFYANEFDKVKASCGSDPAAAEIIHDLHERGYRVILATNPIFPARATQWRIQWAGLKQEDFELITTYENSCHCKPNPDYYKEILEKQGLTAEECVMVGNDVVEDMMTADLGMKVFLLTDCLLNKNDDDISIYPQGGFNDLAAFLKEL